MAPLPINLRPMELKDLAEVYELGQELFTAEKWPTLYRSWDDHELMSLYSSSEDTCLVAEASERIVGFALGRIMEKPRSAWRYGWVLWLGVSPRFHRARVATRLLKRLTEVFVSKEARILLVDTDESNRQALSFFRRQGFGQAVRHIYLSRNLDDHPRAIERRFDGKDTADDT